MFYCDLWFLYWFLLKFSIALCFYFCRNEDWRRCNENLMKLLNGKFNSLRPTYRYPFYISLSPKPEKNHRQISLSTMWSRWLLSSLQMLLVLCKLGDSMPGSSTNYKINPKPCLVNTYEGTCMFVWECIKSEGRHIGMCVDSFMFGSCCAHNLTENIVVPQRQQFDFKPPVKKQRPPSTSNRPSLRWTFLHSSFVFFLLIFSVCFVHSGTTTIHRPHGGGTLVIRPSQKRPSSHSKPTNAIANRPITHLEPQASTIHLPDLAENTVSDLDTASSISTGKEILSFQHLHLLICN